MSRIKGASRMVRVATVGSVGLLLCVALVGISGAGVASASGKPKPEVLYVGTFDGISTPSAQTFSTIQGAINAATKGDWILIAPGDYHESDDAGITSSSSSTDDGYYGGVVITTSDLHVRGMNRNSVIVDGTLPGSPRVQLRTGRPELPERSRPQRDCRLEGGRRERRQLDGVQFPGRLR